MNCWEKLGTSLRSEFSLVKIEYLGMIKKDFKAGGSNDQVPQKH